MSSFKMLEELPNWSHGPGTTELTKREFLQNIMLWPLFKAFVARCLTSLLKSSVGVGSSGLEN